MIDSPQPIFALSDGCNPTEDIYLRNTVAPELCRRHGFDISWINCKRTNPVEFFKTLSHHSVFVLFRTLQPDWIEALTNNRNKTNKIIYVLDDDLRAAAYTPQLPKKYRARISSFATTHMNTLLKMADELVVCSEHLSEQYSDYHPKLLLPTLNFQSKKRGTFNARPLQIFYHATGSHKDDLALLEEPLVNILDSNNCSFESLIGDLTPELLRSHKKVRVRNQKSWREFKLFQRLSKRHIGLAPLLDTPYNRGKSHIKFLDISALGAVGIYSNRRPYSCLVSQGVDGFLADDNSEQWTEYISYLIRNPGIASKMAAKAGEKATAIGHPRHAYKFWLKLLSN